MDEGYSIETSGTERLLTRQPNPSASVLRSKNKINQQKIPLKFAEVVIVNYVSHQGSEPMSVTFTLENKI